MNQQRSRRFRAANDAREGLERALEMGEAGQLGSMDYAKLLPSRQLQVDSFGLHNPMISKNRNLHLFVSLRFS
eukprot:388220-Amphidinium_carterae.1